MADFAFKSNILKTIDTEDVLVQNVVEPLALLDTVFDLGIRVIPQLRNFTRFWSKLVLIVPGNFFFIPICFSNLIISNDIFHLFPAFETPEMVSVVVHIIFDLDELLIFDVLVTLATSFTFQVEITGPAIVFVFKFIEFCLG